MTWETYEFNTKVLFSVHIVTALASTVLVLETEFVHYVSKGSPSCFIVKRIQQLWPYGSAKCFTDVAACVTVP